VLLKRVRWWARRQILRPSGSSKNQYGGCQRYYSRVLELRAAVDLAQAWIDRDKPDDARKLLAPVYNWFTEGFDTADLKETKGLLKRLN
jgi:predicted ATPase